MSRTSDIVVALATAQSPADGNPYHTEKGNKFQDFAHFDEEVNNTGTDPTVDFITGNKQRCSNVAVGNITLVAPGVGNYVLRIDDSTTHTFVTGIKWDSGTAPTWAGEAIVALYYDGSIWYGSAIVGAA